MSFLDRRTKPSSPRDGSRTALPNPRPTTHVPARGIAIPVGTRACCCPAHAAVTAVIPADPGRSRYRHTDLLLCVHHFRASRATLATAGAVLYDASGQPLPAG
jgi:hypothetical protein